jgi:hypothetical protein
MKSNLKKIFLSALFLAFNMQGSESQSLKADLVIFSFDRPLQLYALLESIKEHVTGLGEIHVIYRASSETFAKGYEEVKKDFSQAKYVIQGENPRNDFKPLTLNSTFKSSNSHIIYAVDDIIVKDAINLSECISLLENTGAYAFYLRLGKNLSECYAMNHAQSVPSMVKVSNDVYAWCFAIGELDWAYPHTVDMTLYRKKDIEHLFNSLNYSAPNTLEAQWAGQGKNVMRNYGLCYETSRIVNVPLNIVQSDIPANRNMNYLSAQKLLDFFLVGIKMDIKSLYKINNKAAHMNYEPTFRVRSNNV